MGVRKLHMRQAYRIIPVYTADVSGVCSALYELGGMVVMHDPSGCNSTYNTHDEIRWYEQDSLIYISAVLRIPSNPQRPPPCTILTKFLLPVNHAAFCPMARIFPSFSLERTRIFG